MRLRRNKKSKSSFTKDTPPLSFDFRCRMWQTSIARQ
jgi:hypothetical protein